MKKSLKSLVASVLVVSFLSMPSCLAASNYTYTTTVKDNNKVEPVQGTVVNNTYYDNYNTPAIAMNYAGYGAYPNGYVPCNGYLPYNGYAPYYNGYAGYNTGYIPATGYYPNTNTYQPYNRNYEVTQTYEDTRPEVDKNIGRTAKVAGIAAGLAVVGAAITYAFVKKDK